MKKASLFILGLLIACSTIDTGSSILDDSKCELPCWNNITPGQTSQKVAVQIIGDLVNVDKSTVIGPNQPSQIFNGIMHFSYSLESGWVDKEVGGDIFFENEEVIALWLADNLNLTFGEMIKKTGEPESIISMYTLGGGSILIAINSMSGVGFEFYPRSNELQPDTMLDGIMLFDVTRFEELLETGMFSMGNYDANETREIMYEWNGYGDIEELYPPRFP